MHSGPRSRCYLTSSNVNEPRLDLAAFTYLPVVVFYCVKFACACHASMGTVSSGLTDGFSRATCCVQRRAAARCLNPHLNLQLLKWEHDGAKIEEVWLIRDSSPSADLVPQLSSEPSDARLAIVYNISVGSSGLKPLRLDWRPEGLGFMQLD